MKAFYPFILILLISNLQVHAQLSEEYRRLVSEAFSFYEAGDYNSSAEKFKAAFAANNDKGASSDRYNAACSFALDGQIDEAFSQLERIVEKMNYTNLAHITSDADLDILHKDPRWYLVVSKVKQNKESAEALLDKELVAILEKVYADDQSHRGKIDKIMKEYGQQSTQMDSLWKAISLYDSINAEIVFGLLDKHGWMGPEVVGNQGVMTLFLVIQHSELDQQLKYFEMMKQAVADRKLNAANFAMLEDRILMRQGKKQKYGSQLKRDHETGKYVLYELENPAEVEKLRAEVGLEPLADYLARFEVKRDPSSISK